MDRTTFKQTMDKVRASFKEDAWANAEKSIRLEKKGAVALVVLDQAGEKANKLSTPNMLRLFDVLTQIEADRDLKAAVLISRKPTIFVAGADIAEIKRLSSGEGTAEDLMKLQSVFNYLENLPIPTIAAIHGACVGGGMELALACRFRMASDGRETKLGLPEVMLGVIPGWGGTQRMPKLIGLEAALDLILTGKQIDSKKAKKIGLVDKVVPTEFLEEKALAWAESLAKSGGKREPRKADLKSKLLETVPGGSWVVLDIAKKSVLEKTKGNYPAPLKAIEVIRKTFGGSLETGLKIEAEAFAELVRSAESKNLIEVFYLNEKVKRDKGTANGVAGKSIARAGVLGAGVMGGGIAQLFAEKQIRVRMKDISWDSIAKGYQAAHKVFQKQVERRRLKPSDKDNAMERIEGTLTYAGFVHLDLVVEAAVENLDIKKKVLAELDQQTNPAAVLATNTSSLSVTEMGKVLKNPSRFVGMHFFNPVDKMPLVEVIRSAESSDEAVATVFQLAKKIGKTPIVVKDSPGFVVNRILTPYLAEAVHLLMDGVAPEEMDRAIEKFGMPMGPCLLLDEIGLDVAAKVLHVLYGAFGERLAPPPFIDVIVKEGRLGKKSGKGIYVHDGRTPSVDATLLSKVKVTPRASDLTDEVVVKRLIYLMVNEAARCVEENLVSDIADIDIGMIFGTGFAPFRGGLLRYADSVGAESIVSDLELFSRKYGARFQPSNYLQQLAINGKTFFPK